MAALSAVALLSALCLALAVRVLRQGEHSGLRAAAAFSTAVYAVYAVTAGGANLGVANGLNPVWGLSVAFLASVALTAPAPAVAYATRAHRSRLASKRGVAGALAAMLLAIGAVVTYEAVLRDAGDTFSEKEIYLREGSQHLLRVPASVTLKNWRFDGALPIGWLPAGGVEIGGGGPSRLVVRTDASPMGYQLMAPVVRVPAGTYLVRAEARVAVGGMVLGLLDESGRRWLATSRYSATPDAGSMAVSLTTTHPLYLRVVLSNWRSDRSTSLWSLRRVELRRVRVPLRYRGADPSPRAEDFAGSRPKHWSFRSQLPASWSSHETRPTRALSATRLRLGPGAHLRSPAKHLDSGTHVLHAKLGIASGGLRIGVIDAASGRVLGEQRAWHGQTAGVAPLGFRFELHRETSVRVVVRPWQGPATVVVRSVELMTA